MVRIKHRYLLLNILFPTDPNSNSPNHTPTPSKTPDLPLTIQFHRPSPAVLDARLLVRLIRDGVSELFGDYGAGMVGASLQVKYCSPATSTAIVRVSRDHYRLVWAALAFVTSLPSSGKGGSGGRGGRGGQGDRGRGGSARGGGSGGGRESGGEAVVIRVVRVSGTMRKAEEEAVRRARAAVRRAKAAEGSSAGVFGLGAGLGSLATEGGSGDRGVLSAVGGAEVGRAGEDGDGDGDEDMYDDPDEGVDLETDESD